MKKILKIIFPFEDFLYLLQQEGYETDRYFRLLSRFFWRRNIQNRAGLVWTKRAKIILVLALPLSILIFPLVPIWIGISNLLTCAYFEKIKKGIQKKATDKFDKQNGHTKVIMIAGSYGKTTTKNYIYELIKYNYKTQMIPGNINTLTGIANWVNSDFDKSTEVLISEVDPYWIGEIKEACKIIPPDIAILTHIGDQHLERLATKENLKKALEEVFVYAKPDAIKLRGKKESLDYALQVAGLLKIPSDIIADTTKKLKPPDRRGDIKKIFGFEVIDESYNISESTAKRNVTLAKKAAKKKNKQLIVVTAGIPELGEKNKNANKNLGKNLEKSADIVVVLKSIFYKDIVQNKDKFNLAQDLHEAWSIIKKYTPKNSLVLMLPELGDQYYNE